MHEVTKGKAGNKYDYARILDLGFHATGEGGVQTLKNLFFSPWSIRCGYSGGFNTRSIPVILLS